MTFFSTFTFIEASPFPGAEKYLGSVVCMYAVSNVFASLIWLCTICGLGETNFYVQHLVFYRPLATGVNIPLLSINSYLDLCSVNRR